MDIQQAKETLNQAIQAHQAGDMEKAVRLYENVLDHEPDPSNLGDDVDRQFVMTVFSRANNNLGILQIMQNEQKEARRSFRRALDWAPGNVDALTNLALLHDMMGDHDRAGQYFEEALSMDASFLPAKIGMCHNLISLGQHEKALQVVSNYIRQNPSTIDFPIVAAEAAAHLRRIDESLQWAERALALDNAEPAARNVKLRALFYAGQHDQVIEVATAWLKEQPAQPVWLNNLGLAYQAKGDGKKAVESFIKAIESQERFEPAYGNLGNVFATTGMLDELAELLERAKTLFPQSRQIQYLDAKLSHQKGDLETARQKLESVPEPEVPDRISLRVYKELADVTKTLGDRAANKHWIELAEELAGKLPAPPGKNTLEDSL